ncbi:MAG: 2-polyprenyl-3-methyl-5-hydroxy-6-metoxy-1,4-benzoquinol methylase [Arenicella sp.]|jgi:2-polyprenyl-3-methyl-5-hydroxy-6-metoxy-1,4-benzoquinol methylase
MTWEETIKHIRKDQSYEFLVEKTYLDEDLLLNLERFEASEEFTETIKLFQEHAPQAKTILDIGCGNGITAIAFAKLGYEVTAVEPDSSDTVGAGAIRFLAKHFNLENIRVEESFAEDLNFPSEYFDLTYVRQAMHHANNLSDFIYQAGRMLKFDGTLITIRDHVIFDKKDKEWFLETHPLHKFYGGENAYKPSEYKDAFVKAGLKVEKEIKFFDSVINYYPLTINGEGKDERQMAAMKDSLNSKIGTLSKVPFIFSLYETYLKYRNNDPTDEKKISGRMYSYVAKKMAK